MKIKDLAFQFICETEQEPMWDSRHSNPIAPYFAHFCYYMTSFEVILS